ncbi:Cytosol aminopeptidase PepA [Liberibacter crescens BT-1]|uniref:Probable cytosol aminopeptidase n=1 Tax=Liberibacter crescens (strain BT-1) TaxID=1215343 RepID=L0ETF4_LIBCB|nr:leucyl aminopeptidase [Liberibacter crescens]AGA64237.1 Cytosol aminopeptidase PepA [Liberibacter crescens BT-1]AMC12478.1 aminopeptidase A [Liberibacter crescens]
MNVNISFSVNPSPSADLAIILTTDKVDLEDICLVDPKNVIKRAAEIERFTGKDGSVLNILVPEASPFNRLAVIGLGRREELDNNSWLKAGGNAASLIGKAKNVVIFVDSPEVSLTAQQASNFSLGLLLRAYSFDQYKTRKDEISDDQDTEVSVLIVMKEASAAKKAFVDVQSISDGVNLTRTLVNEPANILGTLELAERAKKLEEFGVEVDILDKDAMAKLGMGALLAVSQGSSRPPYLVIMKWNGKKTHEQPLAFVGKGVVFDTGGISIKPSSNMEDMKSDMAGAATVIGLLQVLAARKAKVNVVGIIGLVENMPDGSAQRPGDIVTSMSGQTIEIINTDAEGRLVLADALWYCKEYFQPRLIIDLATLTGAIMVSLGTVHAGLFSNDDKLVQQLIAAGLSTGEYVWHMPMGKDYDKLIDSKFADIKNSGGRYAGSITAAQFLKRFVDNNTPWAHLDIAGMATCSSPCEVNVSWGSGFGVRLLDEFIKANYE